MAKNPYYRSFYLNPERDADIIEFLEHCESNGFTISDVIRQAIRYYAGLLSQKSSEEVNQALLRIIQLEKKFNEFVTKQEERYQRLLDLVQEEIEQSRKERKEMRKELELLKEGYKKFEEKAKEKEAEEERKKREEFIQELKKEFIARAKPYLKAFRSGDFDGSYTLLTYQIKQLVKEYEEKGLSRDWLWRICFEEAPNLRRWVENEIRRKYV